MEYKLQDLAIPLNVSRIANVHYFEFTSEYQTTDDSHNFCELLYVDKGSICVYSEHYSGLLSNSRMIIHKANEIHSLACNKNIFPHVIIIGFECDSDALDVFSKHPVTLLPPHRKLLADVMKEGMNVFEPPYNVPNTLEMNKSQSYPYGSEQMLKLYLECFLISIVRDYDQLNSSNAKELSQNQILSDICKYVTEHYTEKILLDNICFLFNTNKTTLCQSFKDKYGFTILTYINQLKIKEAKKLLLEQELSITDIAEKLGYNSIHYFSRHFKKHTGMTPSEYMLDKS